MLPLQRLAKSNALTPEQLSKQRAANAKALEAMQKATSSRAQ